MRPFYHVTAKSTNRKTGPCVVTTHSRATCPATCPLRGDGGCYGEKAGPLTMHWDAVTCGRRGTSDLGEHCDAIRAASAKGAPVRHCQVGDLPESIAEAVAIGDAPHENARAAWGYTHRTGDVEYLKIINLTRSTFNASTDTPEDAARVMRHGVPAVCLLTGVDRKTVTTDGTIVIRCPAEYRDDVTCYTCGNGRPLCARKDRSFAIGFTPHGNGAKQAARIAAGKD